MRIIVLYRVNSEHARHVEEYITDFQRFHSGQSIEALNVDSIEGSEKAELYGVMEYPTVLALKDDGQMQQMWSGVDKLPLMNDLAYYAQQ
jgi:thiol-disulfide isomerase/thioredoxin